MNYMAYSIHHVNKRFPFYEMCICDRGEFYSHLSFDPPARNFRAPNSNRTVFMESTKGLVEFPSKVKKLHNTFKKQNRILVHVSKHQFRKIPVPVLIPNIIRNSAKFKKPCAACKLRGVNGTECAVVLSGLLASFVERHV